MPKGPKYEVHPFESAIIVVNPFNNRSVVEGNEWDRDGLSERETIGKKHPPLSGCHDTHIIIHVHGGFQSFT